MIYKLVLKVYKLIIRVLIKQCMNDNKSLKM